MNFNLSSAEQMVQFAVTNKNAILGLVALFCALLIYKMITSSDWVKVIIGIVIMIFVVHTLTACSVSASHDFGGFTERAQLRADAQSTQVAEKALAEVQVAEAQRDAQVGAAKETAKGVIESARSAADAKIASNRAWAGTMPILLVIAGFAALLIVGMYWRGRVGLQYAVNDQYKARAELGQAKANYLTAKKENIKGMLKEEAAPPTPLLTDAQVQLLYYYAQQKGMQVRVMDNQYFLEGAGGFLTKVTPKGLLNAPSDS